MNVDKMIKGLKKNDEKSFEFFLKEFEKPLYYFIYRYVNNHDDAKEIASQTYFKLLKNIENFKPKFKSSFKTWLYQIAKNLCIDMYKKHSRQKSVSWDTENGNFGEFINSEESQPYERIEEDEEKRMYKMAMKKLKPELRAVLEMRVNQQLSYKDIAEILSIPVGTAKYWNHEAIARLTKIVSQERVGDHE